MTRHIKSTVARCPIPKCCWSRLIFGTLSAARYEDADAELAAHLASHSKTARRRLLKNIERAARRIR